MCLHPDLDTFAVMPWTRDDADAARADLRRLHARRRAVRGRPALRPEARRWREAEELGYYFNTGPELEFFLFSATTARQPRRCRTTRPATSTSPPTWRHDVRKEMVNALEAMGIEVESGHHEVALGQHEIDFQYADALHTADNAVTFKYTSRPSPSSTACTPPSCPSRSSASTARACTCTRASFDADGKNAVLDPTDEYGLSTLAKHFIAGQLEHARGMCGRLAPLVNSYKRLVPGYEAPVYICWARTNRSALIRVPRYSPGARDATRVELRCPDPSCNPYLAFAVMLAAGLDGIKRKLRAARRRWRRTSTTSMSASSKRRNIGTLPGTLGEALDELERDEVMHEALGEHVFERFCEAKRAEWDEYRMQVTHVGARALPGEAVAVAREPRCGPRCTSPWTIRHPPEGRRNRPRRESADDARALAGGVPSKPPPAGRLSGGSAVFQCRCGVKFPLVECGRGSIYCPG